VGPNAPICTLLREALEDLQRRSSMHDPLYRTQLAAYPDAITFPGSQIEAGLVRVGERRSGIVGFAVLLGACAGMCELDGCAFRHQSRTGA